jgi:ribose transport system ATP-binding protein
MSGEMAPAQNPFDAAKGPPVIAFKSVTKRFGQTEALSSISFAGHAGSVHAITGENGAGKSTLMKLLAGVYRVDSGEILLNGNPIRFAGPRAALSAGISTVFQELTLLPNLTIAENLVLGREPQRARLIDRTAMKRKARDLFQRLGIDLDIETLCGELTVAEQHLIEIAKGAGVDADVFIFDEPTAALDAAGVAKLENLIRAQKEAGKLVFYISHRLDEIFRFCDAVTVLKDGKHVVTTPTDELTRDRLVSLMVGREISQLYPQRKAAPADMPALLTVADLVPSPARPALSFALKRGEILGLAGLEGQGQRDIIRALAGLQPHARGHVTKSDATSATAQELALSAVATALAGVGFIPEDRKSEGLYLPLSIAQNIGLGMLRRAALPSVAAVDRKRIEKLMDQMSIRAKNAAQVVATLSGGNQQKVMIGRLLASGVDVLLIEEPTRGVDVGAKSEIYALLRDFADKGGGVLITSSELTEHLGLCDRILVIRAGAIVAEMAAIDANEETIMKHALVGSRSANEGVAAA